ncbi:MAG: hypothetical protein CL609_15165, partial [Anaerolineaceae bacterium]|nr:hypothetical protein [Anaerolineaceae bacterium]
MAFAKEREAAAEISTETIAQETRQPKMAEAKTKSSYLARSCAKHQAGSPPQTEQSLSRRTQL